MKPGFPLMRTLGLSLVLLGLSVWLTPAFDQFANCRIWQAKLDANEPFSFSVGQNHHVSVSNFRQDSAVEVGAKPYGPEGGPYLTYVPILPARAVGKPLYEDFRLVLRARVNDPQQEIVPLMDCQALTGIVRRPQMTWTGKIFHEDDVISNWCKPAPDEWYILDTVPRPYIQWTDLGFLLPLAIAVWCSYQLGCIAISARPESQILPMAVGAVVLMAGGIVLLLLQPAGPAAWNTVSPWLATMAIALGAGTLPAFVTQLLVNRLKQQELERQKAAIAALDPEEANAAPFEVTPTGFILRDGTGKHEFLDAAVSGIAIQRTSALNASLEQVILRSVRLRVADGKNTDSFSVRNVLTREASDPLQPFFTRLISSMGRRYAADLKSSGELAGEGWSLSACGLTLIRGDKKETFGPKLLNSAEWVRDRFCIWTAENEEPVLTLDSSSENVYVLAEVIPVVLPGKLLPTKFTTGLGRLRCALSCKLPQQGPAILRWISGTKTSRFRCFDEGVQVSVSGSPLQTFRFGELDSSTWNLKSSASGGNSVHSFSLTPSTGDPVTFEFSLPQGVEIPGAVLDLKNRVIEATAKKLLEKLARTGSAPWTSRVTLRLDGFSVNGASPVPYADVQEMKLDEAQQDLLLSWKTETCQVPADEPNFDAGWQIFQLIRQTVTGDGEQSSPRTAPAPRA